MAHLIPLCNRVAIVAEILVRLLILVFATGKDVPNGTGVACTVQGICTDALSAMSNS